jgi:uncharacterized protein DUF3810
VQQSRGSFFRKIRKNWKWICLISLAIVIKIISFFPAIVETYYTYGMYPVICKIQRIAFGWIPFSIGDFLYAVIVLYFLAKIFQLIKAVFQKKISKPVVKSIVRQLLYFSLSVYVFLNALWGLNYSRQGISSQLGLKVQKYNTNDLDTLTGLLQHRLNQYALLYDSARRRSLSKKTIFHKSSEAYKLANKQFSFLKYSYPSLKPSMYTYMAQFFGFTGYYNPFTGEGQVRTNVPVFIQPFISTHEIAHQLGYGKENEANFVAFLVCKLYDDNDFRYSLYFDLYSYSISELFNYDYRLTKKFYQTLDTQVKKDRRELWRFYSKSRNIIEPLVLRVYDQYLRMNNQPKGRHTYNEVLAWLIAYYKKYGKDSI